MWRGLYHICMMYRSSSCLWWSARRESAALVRRVGAAECTSVLVHGALRPAERQEGCRVPSAAFGVLWVEAHAVSSVAKGEPRQLEVQVAAGAVGEGLWRGGRRAGVVPPPPCHGRILGG